MLKGRLDEFEVRCQRHRFPTPGGLAHSIGRQSSFTLNVVFFLMGYCMALFAGTYKFFSFVAPRLPAPGFSAP